MVNYSLINRANPRDKDASKKTYAIAQYAGVMNLEKFASHIATHGCVYSEADIIAILKMAVNCMREQLLNGQKIKLGDLGSFYLSLSSKGTLTAEDFDPTIHVKAVNVNWERGPKFRGLKDEAEFNLVAGRAVQKKVLAALKSGETTVTLVDEKEDEGDEVIPDA